MSTRDRVLGIGGLAVWLLLMAGAHGLDDPGVVGLPTPASHRPLQLPLAWLVLLRLASAASGRAGVRRLALGVWLVLSAAVPAATLPTSPWLPLLGLGLGALSWWVAARLDRLGLDGAFVLLLPQAAIAAATWYVAAINRSLAGILSPWLWLDAPVLPLLACAALLALRPPSAERRVLAQWAPRTALPILLLPFAFHQLLLPVLPDALVPLARWLGVLAALAVVLAARPRERTPWWPGLLVALVPVQVLTVGLTLWGAGLAEQRYGGAFDATWRMDFERAPTPADLARFQSRLDAAKLDGEVSLDGPGLRVTLRGIEPSAGEWWLLRTLGRPGSVGLHTERTGEEAERLIQQSTSTRTQPSTWTPPPGALLWGHRRCPGKRCQIRLLEPSLVPPDAVVDVHPGFDPLTWSAWVDLELTSHAAERLTAQGRAVHTLVIDDRLYGEVRSSDGRVRLHVGHPGWARRIPERLAGGPIQAGPARTISLEEQQPAR